MISRPLFNISLRDLVRMFLMRGYEFTYETRMESIHAAFLKLVDGSGESPRCIRLRILTVAEILTPHLTNCRPSIAALSKLTFRLSRCTPVFDLRDHDHESSGPVTFKK